MYSVQILYNVYHDFLYIVIAIDKVNPAVCTFNSENSWISTNEEHDVRDFMMRSNKCAVQHDNRYVLLKKAKHRNVRVNML